MTEAGGVPLPAISMSEFLGEVEATKPELGRGISEEMNAGTFDIVEGNTPLFVVSPAKHISYFTTPR